MFKFCLNMFQHLLIYRGPTLHKSFGSSIKVFFLFVWTDHFQVTIQSIWTRTQSSSRKKFSTGIPSLKAGGATNVIPLEYKICYCFFFNDKAKGDDASQKLQ
jgi:hypothetical protein